MGVEIVQGVDKTLTIRLVSELTERPYDLTGKTEISVSMKKTDGTYLTKTLTSTAVSIPTSDLLGEMQVVLNNTDTASLRVEADQSIQVTIDKSTDKKTFIIEKAITVKKNLV